MTVFVPETTSQSIIQRMHDEGAEVRIAGLVSKQKEDLYFISFNEFPSSILGLWPID